MFELLPHQKEAYKILRWLLFDDDNTFQITNPFMIDTHKNPSIKLGNRATGRSTVLAYTYLMWAIENPNSWVRPSDWSIQDSHYVADRFMLLYIRRLAEELKIPIEIRNSNLEFRIVK